MSPSRLQSHATTAGRWTDEEHEILVDLTNHQLELEKQDETKVISWAKHWDNVATQLKKSGYVRTPAACLGYWKRTVGAQKANEKAAGPRWDDGEHQILVGMTEEQLEAEAIDPAAVMSWQRHWKKVSERLKEEGYSRSVDACDAYWNLVQDNSPLAVGNVDDEDESSEEALEVEPEEGKVESEEAQGSEEAVESEKEPESKPEQEPEPESEPEVESEKEVEVVVPEQEPEKEATKEEVTEPDLYTPAPAPEEPEKPAEASSKIEPESQTAPTAPKAPPKSPSPQVGWSSVNRGRRPKTPRKSVPEPYYPEEEAKTPISLEDHVPYRNILPEAAPHVSPGRPKKHKTTAFRFQPEQRAFLEEEVIRNGSNPDQNRRLEIASELGVEEKTVRNWFVHHRQRASRRSLETRPREDFAFANEYSLPNLAAKRGRHSLDLDMDGVEEVEATEVAQGNEGQDATTSNPSYLPQHKRPRIEGELTPDPAAQARIATPTQPHSMHPYGKPQRILSSNHPEDSPASRGSTVVHSPPNELINIIRKIPDPAAVLPSNSFEDQPQQVTRVPAAGMGGRPRRASPPPGPPGPPGPPVPSTEQPQRTQLPAHLMMKNQPTSNHNPNHNPRTVPQALQERGIPIDAKFIMESGEPPSRAPASSGITFKSYHHPTNKNPADYESPWKGTPIKFDDRPATSRSSHSQSSSFREHQNPLTESTEASSVTPGPGLGSTPTPRAGENDKSYAARKVAEIQAHIQTLKQDSDTHIVVINRLEAQIDQVKRQENVLYQQKENEIQQFLRDIEQRYQRDVAVLSDNHRTLQGKKEVELDALRKNQRQVEKSEKKMRSYQTIVDVDDDSS